ncbi:alpha-amylase family glycosyl hydrolase, partial [Bacillus sp. JJ722]|uniref:alpha-amylase family glycosyl hydrolase n=1 Tax=Bacillus sp. JJ722 TaxID=3122973 RepID=UPI002FFE7760
YNIMIDRFNNGSSKNDYKVDVQDLNGYNGGDFQGIIDKLDYIKDMGFTTISLSPIFNNEDDGYDGTRVIDFYKTEEHFGSIKEFKQLVKEAHKRELKVVLEFVVDEVGPNHPWIKDPSKKDWFTEAPKLNLNNREVQSYLTDAAKWWEQETNIDGYYIKQIQKGPKEFWTDFAKELRTSSKEFFLIGEVQSNDLKESASYQLAGFDSIINMQFMEPARNSLGKVDSSFDEPMKIIEYSQKIFNNLNQVGLALDNSETIRFTNDIVANNHNPGSRWKLALTYTYTTPGIPFVFYGSEIALAGEEKPDNLRLMGFKADKQLIDFTTSLGGLRQSLPALTRGDFKVLYNREGMLVYKRSYKSEVIVVAINNSSKTQHVTLTEKELDENKELRGLLAGDLVREEDGKYKLVVKREEAEIYALAEKTSIKIGYISGIVGVWVVFAIFIFIVMKRSKRNAS